MILLALALLAGCSPEPAPQGEDRDQIILVRPFQVLGQEEGAEYVGEALARSLSIRLSEAEGLDALEVPPVEDGSSVDDRFGRATRIIAGTLTRDGEGVHARVQLFDAASDDLLWEDGIVSDRGDLSELSSRLAHRTARGMNVAFPDYYDYIGDVTGGPEMSGSELAERVRVAWRSNDVAEFRAASSELVSRFPDEPAAHAYNAFALLLTWDADPSDEELLSALRERLAALDRIDPLSPYDELLRAYVYRSSGQPDQARVLYSRVLARNNLTSSARAWVLRQRSFTYLQAGNPEAAQSDIERAVTLDPTSALNLVALSKTLEPMDRLDGAIASARQALALQPLAWRHHQRLGIALSRSGNHAAAVESLEQACRLGERQEACANLAVAFQRWGRGEDARATAEHSKRLSESRWGYYNLGCYRALAGDRTGALVDLRRALDLGFADALIESDPDLATLRGDPEFEAIVRAVGDRIRTRRQLTNSVFPWQA